MSIHEAYEVFPLVTLSSQIESVAAYADNLLIGTRQGFLFMYNIEPGTEEKFNVQLMRFNKSFSKKSVNQLEVIPDYQLLVSLTDNIIQVHDINSINFNTIAQIERSRGATYFTINMRREKSLTGKGAVLVRMAVVVKRKLQLYYLKHNEFLPLGDDINLSEIPKCILWSQESICIGYKGEYALVDLSDKKNKQTELFPTSGSRSSEPCMVRVSDRAYALCRDSQTVLVNFKGETEVTTSLKWSDVPLALVWDEPYALAALADKVEIKTPYASEVTQSFEDLAKVRFLVSCNQGRIYAASLSQVWAISGVNIAKQRKLLLEAKQFQLALKLTAISDECEEDKNEKIHHIQTLLAYDLFANKHFHESMKEFQKLKTKPYDVIRLFPELVSSQQLGENTPPTGQALVGKDFERGLLALIDYLTDIRHPLKLEVLSNDKNSKSALHLLQIIDTTLLKCYLRTNDALVAPLLRLNYCYAPEAEKVLKKMGRHNELVILYQTIGEHRKALELLKSEKAVERTIKYLQHIPDQVGLVLEFANWVLTESPEEGLRIFTEYNPDDEQPPKPRVLDFLLRSHPTVVIPYLEHVVHVWKDTSPLFHNTLIYQYRERCMEERTDFSRRLLLEFLEKSQHYTSESVLVQFPNEGFLEERALILGRLGRHDQALAIYIRVLGDIDKALAYCNKVYDPNNSKCSTVYISLLKLILDPDSCPPPNGIVPPETATPDVELALKIMEEHASRLDPLQTLSSLPDNVSVARIRSFLLFALHKAISDRRKAQLLKSLLYAEHLQCQELKFRLQAQKVLITELNVCPVCKKRFGNQSALVRYPNGDVVHYSCQDKKL
ncbi:hypothetical protein WA026_006636 [Henosepilachna vigintioctopunctata]|uniref:CNH domain-containing protein n=1 Tax=Henosepilachna vigintioctopunctata TaxID=420089 RepID=A0AAW1UEJ2_9CUCU